MKSSRNMLCRALIYLLMTPTLVFGYGNDGADGGPHRKINQYALEKFTEQAKQDPILSKYDFTPSVEKYALPATSIHYDQPFTIESDTVTRSGPWAKEDKILTYGGFATYEGDKYIEEGKHRDTFGWWIKEGGYTADEPELFMSLRHFYDPTNQTAPYLTDLIGRPVESRVGQHISLMGDNPSVNASDWAMYGSPYSLNDVSKNVLETQGPALKLSLPVDREKNFGRAWRGIGETMHLVADMTVPAHVRNDGHPGQGGLFVYLMSNLSAQYDLKADPYEEYVSAQVVSAFAQGAIEKAMEKKIAAAKTPRELLDVVALYTNTHFFSEDTISGKDIYGNMITPYNGQNAYPAPKLDKCFFEVIDDNAPAYYYVEDELGRVDMASSKHMTTVYGRQAQLSMDGRCVRSEAKRLIPLAIAANERLLELVMPRVGVVIDGLNTKDKTLKCHVIRYNLKDGQFDPTSPLASDSVPTSRERALIKLFAGGETKVFWQLITNMNAGVFEVSLDNIPSIKLDEYLKNDPASPPTAEIKITAGIDMGGIVVWSGEFVPQALNISPEQAELPVSSSQLFRAESLGRRNPGVAWRIREKNGGTITPEGEYRSPAWPGLFHLEAFLINDPTVRVEALIKVNALPEVVTLQLNPEAWKGEVGETLSATVTATNLPVTTAYAWDFGDGTPVERGPEVKRTHTYAKEGAYTITVGAGSGAPRTTAIATVTPQAAWKEDIGTDALFKQLSMLSSTGNASAAEKTGAGKNGFTYYAYDQNRFPSIGGWRERLAAGSTPFKLPQDGNFEPRQYELDYSAQVIFYDDWLYELPEPDGTFPSARKRFEAEYGKPDSSYPEKMMIGDMAIASKSNAAGAYQLLVFRGPVLFRVEVQAHMAIEKIFDWQFPCGRLGVLWPDILNNHNLPERNKLETIMQPFVAGRQEAAIKLANATLRELDVWLARKLGSGPGIKGLYPFDAKYHPELYLLAPQQAPAGFKSSVTFEEVKKSNFAIPSEFKKEENDFIVRATFDLDSLGVGPGRDGVREKAEAPLRMAHDKVDNWLKGKREDRDKPSDISKISLAGTDEAFLAIFHESGAPSIVVRKANMYVLLEMGYSMKKNVAWRVWNETEKKQYKQVAIDMIKAVVSNLSGRK